MKDFTKLERGLFAEQYTPERLADAKAVLSHDWEHFAADPTTKDFSDPRRMLPPQLALRMMKDGKRSKSVACGFSGSAESARSAGVAAAVPGEGPEVASIGAGWSERKAVAKALVQREHSLADLCGVIAARDVSVETAVAGAARTVAEFMALPLRIGMFVVTPGYRNYEGASRRLEGLGHWTWKLLRLYRAGAELPRNNRNVRADTEDAWEAHLYKPIGEDYDAPLRGSFTKSYAHAVFLYTAEERAAPVPPVAAEDRLQIPVVGILRAANIIGGSFGLRADGRLPTVVRRALREREAAAGAGGTRSHRGPPGA